MENLDLLEPVKLYETELKEKHRQNVSDAFDELVKTSGVDIEANKLTCRKLFDTEKKLKKAENGLKRLGGLLALFIILIVVGAISLIIGISLLIYSENIGILFTVLGPIFIAGGIILICLVYKPKRLDAKMAVLKLQEEIKKLKDEAYSQMKSLNDLFSSSISASLFQKTCPLIEMDRVFDNKKYELLREKYGLWSDEDEECSTLDLQSGSILGNPFVFFKEINKTIIQQTYTGSLTITYEVGSGKDRHTEVEVLHASYVAPKPVFSKQTYLIYGNEAASNLSFSREPCSVCSQSEENIRKYVLKHEKDLDKIAAKQMKNNSGQFTPIGNPEFELLFGGLDRDNEVEFRLLFTALGQTSMMQLLKSKEGYGDDFTFKKVKTLNFIQSKHSQSTDLFLGANEFRGFEFESVKNFFIAYNNEYFKSVFFDLAPLLSIPLYQQYKSHEYIYKDIYKGNFSPFQNEVIANKYLSKLAHQKTDTEVIYKTSIVENHKNIDIVNVTAHSYQAIPRVTYIPVRGGDGWMHDVPVHWTEYIDLTKESLIEINDIGKDNEVKFNSLGQNDVIYVKGLLSKQRDNLNVDIEKIKALIKKD